VSPEEQRVTAAISAVYRFSGPLPPPEELAKYEQILPGSANRIISMAEEQSSHRRDLEKTVIGANVRTQTWGLVSAFIIAMTAIGGGIWLSAKGMSGAGLTSIITALAALVGVFVFGKSQQNKELSEKQKSLTEPADNAIKRKG
jgi:uncharacterized membrane protein